MAWPFDLVVKKGWKIFWCSSNGIPLPLSQKLIIQRFFSIKSEAVTDELEVVPVPPAVPCEQLITHFV
jgi:hypothetical protein